MRTLCLGITVAVLVGSTLVGSTPAAAGELLDATEEPFSDSAVGWSMAGLSVVSFLVASNGYQESQKAMDEAENYYKLYLASTTAEAATSNRNAVNRYHGRARAFESSANGAAFLGVVFALASYYAFVPEHLSDSPLVVAHDSVGLRYRF